MVDTGILSNNIKFPYHDFLTFCSLTIYNDNPPTISLYTNQSLITELDLLSNYKRFPYNFFDGCGMLTGDTYTSGHLVPSHLGPNFF